MVFGGGVAIDKRRKLAMNGNPVADLLGFVGLLITFFLCFWLLAMQYIKITSGGESYKHRLTNQHKQRPHPIAW